MIKDEMKKIVDARQLSVAHSPRTDFCDGEEILKCLSQNYEDTIKFLIDATFDEIGCACWVLDDLIRIFPTQELLNCFKSKIDEFAKHDLEENWDSPSVCECIFHEEVAIAEDILKDLILSQKE